MGAMLHFQSIMYLVKQFLWWFRYWSFPMHMLYFLSDHLILTYCSLMPKNNSVIGL